MFLVVLYSHTVRRVQPHAAFAVLGLFNRWESGASLIVHCFLMHSGCGALLFSPGPLQTHSFAVGFMTVLVSFLLQAFLELTPKHPFSDLTDYTWLHVFKGDIQPIWDDAKNLNGGLFKIISRTQERTKRLWFRMVLCLIGQEFPYCDLVVCLLCLPLCI